MPPQLLPHCPPRAAAAAALRVFRHQRALPAPAAQCSLTRGCTDTVIHSHGPRSRASQGAAQVMANPVHVKLLLEGLKQVLLGAANCLRKLEGLVVLTRR